MPKRSGKFSFLSAISVIVVFNKKRNETKNDQIWNVGTINGEKEKVITKKKEGKKTSRYRND